MMHGQNYNVNIKVMLVTTFRSMLDERYVNVK